MSIVKKEVSSLTDVVIMRLPKDSALASPPLPSVHPLLGYTVKYGLALNDYYFTLDFYPRAGETVLIKALFAEDAEGLVYGVNDGSNSRYIIAEDGYINWYNGASGSSPIASKPIDGKIHVYGYIGGETDGTRWCKPFYDGDAIALTESTIGSGANKAVFGAAPGSSGSSASALKALSGTAVTLYEIAATSCPDSSDTSMYDFHYYAASNTALVLCLMETRKLLHGITGSTPGASGYTAKKASVNFPEDVSGYGIQLHDIIHITGSGYKDQIAVLAEDGGVDTEAGWDGIGDATGQADVDCTVSKTGETTLHSAFFLGKNGDSRGHIPVPSGWTVDTQSTYGYVLGELMRGRKPKWDIWNDALKFGFYIDYDGSSRTLRFNLRRIMDLNAAQSFGTKEGNRLEWFENYDTERSVRETHSHPPRLDTIGDMSLHLHNGAFVKCLSDDVIAGIPGDTYNVTTYVTDTVKDDGCVFLYDIAIGKLRFVAGNLVPWNYTRSQMQAKQWTPKGAKMTAQLGHPYQSQPYYAQAIEMADPTDPSVSLIDPNFPAARKALFQSTGFVVDLQLMKNKWQLLDYFDTWDDEATMSAVMNIIASEGDVDCSSLVPSKEMQVQVLRDTNIIQGSSRYRMIVDYVDETENNKIGLVGLANGGYFLSRLDGSTYDGTAVTAPFIPVKLENDVYVPDYTKSSIEYIALFEYYSTNNDTNYDTHFCVLPIVKGVDAYKAGGTYKTNLADSVWQNNSQRKYVWTKGARYLVERNTQAMSDLADNVRMLSAFRSDFDVQSVPSDATVIAHIYNKTTAPFFIKAGTWYASQHVSRDSIGSGGTLRHLVFTKYCYTSDNEVKFTFKFLPYNSDYNISNMGNCVLTVKKNGVNYGKFTIDGYTPYPQDYQGQSYSGYTAIGKNMSGSTISGFELFMYNNAVADELIFGLDNTYWGSAYFGAEITFPSGVVNRGDMIEIDFN